MDEIRLGENPIIASMGAIEKSVNSMVGGFEKAREVIGGLYDDLIMWEDAADYWRKKAFDVRADEIEHLRRLGQISAQEEAQLWRELFDEKLYGWQQVKIAEENYHRAMYEHSKAWIEEQTALGKLSAQEVAEAWERVFNTFDDINIKYQAAMRIRSVLLGEADDEIQSRRADSDRWMRRQDLYDGGDALRQVEDYTRRIEAEKQLLREIESGFLNGVELGAQEQAERWLEVYEYIEDLEDKRYLAAKRKLEGQINDYISASKAAMKEQYDYRLSLLNSQLSALKDEYNDRSAERRQRRLSEELSELIKQRSYYKDAVTKEGQERYKEISSRIKEIYDEQDEIRDRREYAEEEARLREKIADLKADYQKSVEELERSKEGLLQMTGEAALQSISAAESAGVSISNALLGVSRAFSVQVEDMFAKTEEVIAAYTERIAAMLGAVGAAAAGASETNVTVTFNDYGDKNLTGNNAVAGFANEFLSLLKNTLRSKGIK